jgi:hypothetical protein
VNGIHQQHAATRLRLPRAPIERGWLAPVVEALVDKGADANEPQRADRTLGDQPPPGLDGCRPAKLVEDAKLEVAVVRQPAEPAGLFRVERQRLFDQHVLARLEASLRRRCKEVMRQPDIDGRDLRMIDEHLEARARLYTGARRIIRRPHRIGVERGRDPEPGHIGRNADDLARGPAAADEPDADHGR